MSFTTKLAAGVMLAAATSTALTGCGKKSSTNTTSASPSMSSSTSSSKTASSSMSSTTSSDYVTATIGGQTKHIKAGQQCQSKHASDYTQYGFTCAANSNGVYVLTKN